MTEGKPLVAIAKCDRTCLGVIGFRIINPPLAFDKVFPARYILQHLSITIGRPLRLGRYVDSLSDQQSKVQPDRIVLFHGC